MVRPWGKRLFSGNDAADFIGRSSELARILDHADIGSNGLALLAAPAVGTSELLRQAYDHLFFEQKHLIPFYFEIKVDDVDPHSTALRFLREFLVQTVSFRRADPNIIVISPEICEIVELAPPSDAQWIDRMVETCNIDGELNDQRFFLRNCLSAPLRAASHGARAFVMIDGLQNTAHMEGGEGFFNDLVDVFARTSMPFVFAGYRRFLFARTSFDTVPVESLSFTDAGKLVERLATKTGIAINDQTRDLIVVQLAGRARHINALFSAAAASSTDLNSFEQVERVYTDEISSGRMGKYYDALLNRILADTGKGSSVLRLLLENKNADGGRIPLAYWKKHLGPGENEFETVLDALNFNEILRTGPGSVEFDETNTVVGDYINIRSRLEVIGVPRALAIGEALSANVKRAPQLMARSYRQSSAIGLRELMDRFDGQRVSPSLLDYGRFEDELKGAADERILKATKEDNEKIGLPQVVYSAHTSAFYPALNESCDAERSAVALGFSDTAERDEIAWIAAELDAKLEVTRDEAAFWCDRLEMAAINCNFVQFQIWLVAPEGFSPEAIDALRARNAFGSSRKQVDLLTQILNGDLPNSDLSAITEYEIVVPMGEETEMISAHTVEEIAKRHNVPPKAINQIKTALVEACINAAEHSLSPDRKIYQKFAVEPDKITITVSNRGIRLVDKKPLAPTNDEGRRGWGLKLIKGLMDDVTVEQTDDGSRITMVKLLASA
ncbi:MAG: ATP-binding protein [Acidobacteriota bacterium]